jgi:hypothetical protein
MTRPRKLNRREFLELGLQAAAAASLTGDGLAASAGTAPVTNLDTYNYGAGTQSFGASYQFTRKPRLLETAEAIREMGASAIKFRLESAQGRGAERGSLRSLRDAAANDPVVRQIFGMSFGHYLLWAYPQSGSGKQLGAEGARDEELYALCCYLLKSFSGTGKTFYLGHWEGDWEIRGRAGSREDPAPERITSRIRWLNQRQQAVDDAKRDTTHSGVEVFCYAEVNMVRDAMQGRPCMANAVVPHTQIDFVSYSSYDTSNGKDAETEVPKALDYIESKLPPKPGIKGKRVWIGEYGYPACRYPPQEQAARTRGLIKTALQWGCPFVLYWEMYNNEVDKDGKQRGFWLIDDKGAKQPVYYLHHRFLQWARGYVAAVAKSAGQMPTFDEYRKKAVEWLDGYRE